MEKEDFVFSTKAGVIARKILHLLTVVAPMYYIFGEKSTLIKILFPLTAVFIIIEFIRLYIKPIRGIFLKVFSPLLWKEEGKAFTSATRWLISASIVCAYFPKDIAILSLFFVAISDTAAYTVGSLFGKKQIVKGKTLGGTLTFLGTALIVSMFSPLPRVLSVVGAVIATLVELIPRYDDNLSIPILTGGVLWLISLLARIPLS